MAADFLDDEEGILRTELRELDSAMAHMQVGRNVSSLLIHTLCFRPLLLSSMVSCDVASVVCLAQHAGVAQHSRAAPARGGGRGACGGGTGGSGSG